MKQFLFLVVIGCLSAASFGQKLHFKVAGVPDTTVFLVKYYGDDLYYADTTEMKNGVAEFNAPATLKPGIIALLLPGQRYFELIYNNEDINVETSVSDLVGKLKVKKSEENKIFIDYIRFIQRERSIAEPIANERDGLKRDDPRVSSLSKQLDSLSVIVLNYRKNIIHSHPAMLVSKIINMSIDIVIPEAPADENGKPIDPYFAYNFFRTHFWDNVDLKDDRLVNTPVFHQKLEFYFGKNMLLQQPDTVLNAAYKFIDPLPKGSEIFKYVVDYVTNTGAKSKVIGMDKVYIFMADRYYCQTDEKGKSYAYWVPEEKLKELCEEVPIKKKLVLGVIPPNIRLRDTTDVNWQDFYSLKNDFIVLYFWEPGCGHCQKTTPKLQTLYTEKLKARNVEIFAVGKANGDDFEDWKKFIRDNKLTFINVGLTKSLHEAALKDAGQFVPKYTTLEALNYSKTYDVFSTPQIYLLDGDKRIISKQLSLSQLEGILDDLQGFKDAPKLFPEDDEEKDESH